MIFTGRPSRPPALLVSSSQILAPSSACLPLGARPPVRAMLKPILIGSLFCALAELSATIAPAAIRLAPAASAINPDLKRFGIMLLPLEPCFAGILRGFRRQMLVGRMCG